MTDRLYKRLSYFIILFALVVVAAGGIVRTTQSGMGCPDWPTCFGSWIPPMSQEDLPDNYKDYLDLQDIDEEFNAFHTWVEYLNRMVGALLGFLILVYTYFTFKRKKYNGTQGLSLLLLFTVMFTGWLGKVVVEENLAVFKITLHMLTAIVIMILPLYMLKRAGLIKQYGVNRIEYKIVIALLVLVIIQIITGTQVREQVDVIAREMNYGERGEWIEKLDYLFLLHRSSSWLIVAGTFYIGYTFKGRKGIKVLSNGLTGIVLFSVFVGVVLNYFNFPRFAQPLHLISAFMLITMLVFFKLSTIKGI